LLPGFDAIKIDASQPCIHTFNSYQEQIVQQTIKFLVEWSSRQNFIFFNVNKWEYQGSNSDIFIVYAMSLPTKLCSWDTKY
jgi:hypothetical protein